MPASQRFDRSQRLTHAREFATVLSRSQRSADQYFTVLAHRGRLSTARLGLTVSRRAARRAVDRNRLKRLTRETFRRTEDLPAWDFVVMARPAATKADNETLRLSLTRHFATLVRKGTRAT